jgi:F-type H+-transporting ATPase subunit gamma
MELIATARFKQAMDRATAASAYTKRITAVVADLANSGLDVTHPLLEQREETNKATLLLLSGNRGLCGGYNSNVIRAGLKSQAELREEFDELRLEISGKRGITAFNFRKIDVDEGYLQFDDRPTFDEVEVLANGYLDDFTTGKIDRLVVAYTSFTSVAKQTPVVETLLPLGSLTDNNEESDEDQGASGEAGYEFLPSAQSILEEVVPTSFKIKLFKCFLDAAVSEQIARMVAMKSATENANDMIKELSMTYNRARQSQITGEIMEILGGVEALKS